MKKYWIVLKPYSYVSYNKNNAILYNPINKEIIDIESPEIIEQLKELNEKGFNRSIEIEKDNLIKPDFIEFVSKIKNSFIGDIIESEVMPLSIKSITKLVNTFENEELGDISSTEKIRLWEQVREISIYLNSSQSKLNKKIL